MAVSVSSIKRASQAKAAAVFEAGRLLDEMEIRWWLEAGTCLGAVRGGDFIAGDHDIDLGIVPGNDSRWDEIISEFFKNGWVKGSAYRIYQGIKLRLCFRLPHAGLHDEYNKAGKPTVDIFFFYEAGDKWWMGIFGPPKDAVGHMPFTVFYPHVFSRDLFSGMREIDFADRKCLIPNPPETYLVERYGEGWRKPQGDYRFWRDCRAIVSVEEWQKFISKDNGLK
jgi:hypothetical protein